MADPTSDNKTHKKIESRISIIVQGQGQESRGLNGGSVRKQSSNKWIRSCSIDKFLKVGLRSNVIMRLPGLQFFFYHYVTASFV